MPVLYGRSVGSLLGLAGIAAISLGLTALRIVVNARR